MLILEKNREEFVVASKYNFKSYKRVAFTFILFFCFAVTNFPAFLAPPGSEHFPFYLIFTILFLRKNRVRVEKRAFYYLILLSMLLVCVYFLNPGPLSEIAKPVAILLAPLVALIILFPALDIEKLDSVVKSFFWLWLVLSVLVFIPGTTSLNSLLNPVFGNRSGFDVSGYTGAGIIFPEASHAGPLIAFIIAYSLQRKLFNVSLVITFAAVAFLANQSKTTLSLIAVAFLPWIATLDIRKIVASAAIMIIMYFGVTTVLTGTGVNKAFQSISNLVGNGEVRIEDTSDFASGRFIANFVYIQSALNFEFSDMQLSLNKEKFFEYADANQINYNRIHAVRNRGVEAAPILPRSFLALNLYIFSGFGFFIVLFYIIQFGLKPQFTSLYLISIVQLLVVGLPGQLLPFLGLYLATKLRRLDQAHISNDVVK